jgi:arylsulfatase A-like enzyme
VGRIVAKLKEHNLLANTLIIFTSDNGGLGLDELGPTPTSVLPLRKWKGHVYEGGIRVPAIISWPGKIEPGQTSDACFSSTDYLPTLCDLLGIKDVPVNIDGISIASLLMNGRTEYTDERALFWHYPHFSNQLGKPAGAVRLGDFKLVESYETGMLELYDLKNDISESEDLSAKMTEKTRELHDLLIEWRKRVNANMPVPNPDFKLPSRRGIYKKLPSRRGIYKKLPSLEGLGVGCTVE